jgi:hypothetical protein
VLNAHSHFSSEEEITAETPPGKVQYHEMLKVIPGTPQGQLLFYRDIDGFLCVQGFITSEADMCLFYRPPPRAALLILWVDDYVLAFMEEDVYLEFKATL